MSTSMFWFTDTFFLIRAVGVGAGKGQANDPYKNHGRKNQIEKKSILVPLVRKNQFAGKLNVFRLSATEISIEEQETERDTVKWLNYNK